MVNYISGNNLSILIRKLLAIRVQVCYNTTELSSALSLQVQAFQLIICLRQTA
jgi:hypothetical protein